MDTHENDHQPCRRSSRTHHYKYHWAGGLSLLFIKVIDPLYDLL